jgi:hypothetical protein
VALLLGLLGGPPASAEPPETAPPAAWLDELLRGVRELLAGTGTDTADAEEASRVFDAFLTFVVKRAARETVDLGLREEFLAALLEGRHDAVSLVAGEMGVDEDALRELLGASWPRLQPLLEQLIGQLADERSETYRSLVEAARLMLPADWAELQRIALSPDALRDLAHIIAPEERGDPLAYGDDVDPELRALFGFGLPLEPALDNPALEPERPFLPPPLAARIVWAAELPAPIVFGPLDERTALAQRLNGWAPSSEELETYLPTMGRLLAVSADQTLEARPLDPAFRPLFRDLVLATAWKESCWRQFVRRRGKLEAIQSRMGAVGVMQVNTRVWRGFYEVGGLYRDAGYNSRAGSEILEHYLREYAIRKGEHDVTGSIDNLARATYAIYNGGPAHMRRYRNPKAGRSLRAIDQSFWQKFKLVKAGRFMEVARCYGEGG